MQITFVKSASTRPAPAPNAQGEFASLREAGAWERHHAAQMPPVTQDGDKITPHEYKALHQWQDASGQIQAHARGEATPVKHHPKADIDHPDLPHMQIPHIDSAIARTALPHPLTVHRSVLLRTPGGQKIADAKPGDVHSDSGYTATSLNPKEGRRLASLTGSAAVHAKIHLPAGHPALSVDGALGGTYQHEMLLPRHTQFRVLSSEKRGKHTHQEWEALPHTPESTLEKGTDAAMTTPKYSYGSTQVNLPAPLARQVKAWARKWIPRDLLAADGYETTPHITVKYGIKDVRPYAALKTALAPLGPIHATLGTVHAFTTNPDFDVVYLSIESPDLVAANKAVKGAVDCDDTHPEYTPHMTLAYVEKGQGHDLMGSEPFAGMDVTFQSVMLSARSGRQKAIALTGEKPEAKAAEVKPVKKGMGKVGFVFKALPHAGSSYADVTEMVPIHEVKKYREYDRANSPRDHAEFHALKADIAAHGIKEPLMLDYQHNKKIAVLGEGNHRLAAAEALGHTHVPVRVTRSHSVEYRDGHKAVPGYDLKPKIIHGQEYPGHLPGDMKPSEIGLPIQAMKGIDGEPDPKRMAADPDAGKFHDVNMANLHQTHREMFTKEAWQPKRMGKVGDYLHGAKTRSLYAHALDTPVVLTPEPNNYHTKGSYSPESGFIHLNTNFSHTEDSLKNTLLHEASHAVRAGKGRGFSIVDGLRNHQGYRDSPHERSARRMANYARLGIDETTKSVAAPAAPSSAAHPFLGVVLHNGTVSDYAPPAQNKEKPSHSLHYAQAGLTDFDNDDSLRFVKNFAGGHYELEGHAALHPDDKHSFHQLRSLAKHLSDHGVPHSTNMVCADHGYSRSQFPHQGKPLGTVGEYAGVAKGVKLAMLFKALTPEQRSEQAKRQRRGQNGRFVGIKITGNEISTETDPVKARPLALAYANAHLKGRKFVNDETGESFIVGKRGAEHIVSTHHNQIEKIQAIAAIPDLIKHSRHHHTEDDRHGRKSVLAYRYFHTRMRIGTTHYLVKIGVRQMPDANWYYDHNLTKIVKVEPKEKGVRGVGVAGISSHAGKPVHVVLPTATPTHIIPQSGNIYSGLLAFVFSAGLSKSVRSGLKPGDTHPTMPHLTPSDANARSIVKQRGHAPVPPASWGLHVSPDPDAKVQATWHDAAGRQQSRYHSTHTAHAADHKYKALADFHSALPAIRARVQADLHKPDASPDRVKAAVVHLMDHTAIRVGSEKYAQDNGTFGASSLRKHHIAVDHTGGETHAVKVQFTGKHGKSQAKEVHDAPFHAAVSHLLEQPGERLFQQRTKSGGLSPVTEKHVNDYLSSIHPGLHAHQFRTYHGTRIAATYLLSQPHTDDVKVRAKHVRDAMVKVSAHLGNTPEQAKSSYVSPEVVHHYMAGTLRSEHAMETY